ncbi:FAD-dependent thymidylate synthase [Geotalea uraniireducens]|uniref:Flavin-dependent thymidylate synthase n=1 Tax=Geotalea uraniireducens (strain Rf4) TaxID=351605 RepID=A5G8T9_GEOUR|nr:FAD-dependent thymidylate synthase [Geotalea uraniireducens]ABQ28207.1 thymidylate synthase (FAD) [Geotalea uraniireducens Rf4]
MKVALLQHTPDPEMTVALAARLCYSPVAIDELKQRLSGADIRTFLDKIMSLGHQSVLEHASFTFGIEGISRVTSHQLVRHRVASYSQQSQRYVSHKERFAAVIPPTIGERPDVLARFEAQLQALHQAYAEMVEAGIPAEDARYILPNATETKIMVTMNARELLHFFAVRCCERAQWEIRAMSLEMLKLVKGIAPTIFRDAGPGCLSGPCPEGTMTCGKIVAVREFFRNF